MPGLRDKLINDAIEILLDEHVVVPMKDNFHAMFDQQLMNRLSPSGSTAIEFVCPGPAFAAPFPERRRFRSTSLIAITAAHQVVQKHKSQFRITLFERAFQPLILMLSERPVPIVTCSTTTAGCGVTKRIENDELTVAPLELVIVFRQANFGFTVLVAREKLVRKGIGEETLTSRCCPQIRPAISGLAIVIAQSKVQSGGMAKLTNVVALSQVLWFGQLRLHVLAGHECVAEREMEVGLIGQSIAERA